MKKWIILALVLLLMPAISWAAPATCTISGTVYDPTGTPLPNATITFNSFRTQVINSSSVAPVFISTTTDANGVLAPVTLAQTLIAQVTICDQTGTCSAPFGAIVPAATTADFGQMAQGTNLVGAIIASSLTLSGNATIGGTLTVTGASIFSTVTATTFNVTTLNPTNLTAGPGAISITGNSGNGNDVINGVSLNDTLSGSAFGMVADAQNNSTATMALGDNTLTISSAQFALGDVGKNITVAGRAANGVTLYTTIIEYDSPTQVKLALPSAHTAVPTNIVSEPQTLTSDPLPQTVVLVHQQISAVTVKNNGGTITYSTPLDYTFDSSGGALLIPASSTINPGDTIKVTYTYNSSMIWWGTDQSTHWATFNTACQSGKIFPRACILPPGNIMLANQITWTGVDLYGPATRLILAAETSTGVCNGNNEQGAKFSDEQSTYTKLVLREITDVNNDGTGPGCTLRVGALNGGTQQNEIDLQLLDTSGEPSSTRDVTPLHNPIGLVISNSTGRIVKVGRIGPSPTGAPGGFSKPVLVILSGQEQDWHFNVISRPDFSIDNGIYDDANPVISAINGFGQHVRVWYDGDGTINGIALTNSGGQQIVDVYGAFSGDTNLFTTNSLFAAGNTFTSGQFLVPSLETTVAAGPCTGTSCPVTSSTGFVVGTRIFVDTGANAEGTVVTAVTGNTLTVSPALLISHANTISVRRPAYVGHIYRVEGATGATCVAGAAPVYPLTFQGTVTTGACTFIEYGAGAAIANNSTGADTVLNVNGGTFQAGFVAVLSTSPNPTNINNIKARNMGLSAIHCESCAKLSVTGSNLDANGFSEVWLDSAATVFMRNNRLTANQTGRCAIAINGLSFEDTDGSASTCAYTGSTPLLHLTRGRASIKAVVTGSPNADFSTYGKITNTLTTATNATYTMTPPLVAIAYDACSTLLVCQPAAGTLDTVTWPTNCNSSDVPGCISWGGAGAAPALTAVLGEGDLFQFCYDQLDLKWIGVQVATGYKPCPP